MIQEIINFIDYLEANDKDSGANIFAENIKLKEGLYIFLEKEEDELIIKDENILKVDKQTEITPLYNEFIQRYSVSERIRNKSLNSTEKIFIEIGSPFAISISGKGLKIGREKKMQALDAYFKATERYLDNENEQLTEWFADFKIFAKSKMFNYPESNE